MNDKRIRMTSAELREADEHAANLVDVFTSVVLMASLIAWAKRAVDLITRLVACNVLQRAELRAAKRQQTHTTDKVGDLRQALYGDHNTDDLPDEPWEDLLASVAALRVETRIARELRDRLGAASYWQLIPTTDRLLAAVSTESEAAGALNLPGRAAELIERLKGENQKLRTTLGPLGPSAVLYEALGEYPAAFELSDANLEPLFNIVRRLAYHAPPGAVERLWEAVHAPRAISVELALAEPERLCLAAAQMIERQRADADAAELLDQNRKEALRRALDAPMATWDDIVDTVGDFSRRPVDLPLERAPDAAQPDAEMAVVHETPPDGARILRVYHHQLTANGVLVAYDPPPSWGPLQIGDPVSIDGFAYSVSEGTPAGLGRVVGGAFIVRLKAADGSPVFPQSTVLMRPAHPGTARDPASPTTQKEGELDGDGSNSQPPPKLASNVDF